MLALAANSWYSLLGCYSTPDFLQHGADCHFLVLPVKSELMRGRSAEMKRYYKRVRTEEAATSDRLRPASRVLPAVFLGAAETVSEFRKASRALRSFEASRV